MLIKIFAYLFVIAWLIANAIKGNDRGGGQNPQP